MAPSATARGLLCLRDAVAEDHPRIRAMLVGRVAVARAVTAEGSSSLLTGPFGPPLAF
jgi:hypothetical protein